MAVVEGDARQMRSRSRLYEAVLAEVASTPISAVTATAVAIKARVGRATFYRHAESPSALLEDALRSELDALRDGALREDLRDPAERRRRFEATLVQVVRHVVDREAIYGPALLSGAAPGVVTMLIEHVHESVRRAQQAVGPSLWNGSDPVPTGTDPEFFAEAAASGFAHLFVGILTSWLRRGEQRDPDEFLRVFNALAPQW